MPQKLIMIKGIGDPLFKEWIIAIKVMKYSRDITRSNFYQVLYMDFVLI